MPTLITGPALRDLLDRGVIESGDVKCAEGIKYDFRLSDRILKAKYGRPMLASQIGPIDLFVEPGEMVFVLSRERLNIPPDMMAQLSHKRKLSHAGIQIIGGFSIDPNYRGRLLFGLLNFSSSRFPLMPDRKVVAAEFYRLTDGEAAEFPDPPFPIEEFPDDLIATMSRYSPVSVSSVHEAFEKLRNELDALKSEIRSHDQWYKRFEESLDRHDKQIDGLLQSLNAEKEARQTGQDSISTQIAGVTGQLKGSQWQMGIMVGVIVALVVLVITLLIIRH
jgi:dCTP deaminase